MGRLYVDSDKYGYQSDFPIVEAYNAAVKDLVRRRFSEAGCAWPPRQQALLYIPFQNVFPFHRSASDLELLR